MSMALALTLTLALGSQEASQTVEVAFPEMREGRYADALDTIEKAEDDSAAQQINLGVAYARAGEADKARDMFRRALANDAVMLETSSGEWRDSRRLAWQMLALLEKGSLSPIRSAAN